MSQSIHKISYEILWIVILHHREGIYSFLIMYKQDLNMDSQYLFVHKLYTFIIMQNIKFQKGMILPI